MVTFADCQRNPDSDACKQACTASTGGPVTTPGFTKESCNSLYAQFCADPANQSRAICACSLPWASYPGADQVSQYFPNVQEPLCWFAGCKSTGYHKDVPGNICPACLSTLDVNITNATQSGVAGIAQSCQVSSTTSSSVGGAATASSSTTSSSPAAASGTSSTQTASDKRIDDVETFFQQHRLPVLAVGGAVGLLLLALIAFRK